MYLSNEAILIILAVGLIAGWLAGKIVRTGTDLIGDMAIAIVGRVHRVLAFTRLGISLGSGGDQCHSRCSSVSHNYPVRLGMRASFIISFPQTIEPSCG